MYLPGRLEYCRLLITGHYQALAYRFRISYPDEQARSIVDPLFDFLRGKGGPLADGTVDELHLRDLGSSGERNADLVALVSRINRQAGLSSRGSMLIHAGAVARPDGGTVVLCGPSGSGKTTLTAGLASRGYAYVTDETVCLQPDDLRISSFRKPLQVKPGSHHLFPHLVPPHDEWLAPHWLVSPSRLGGADLPGPRLEPQLIVFPSHVAGHRFEMRRLTAADAAYRVAVNSSGLGSVRGGGVAAAARLARRVPAFHLVHDDHQQALDRIEQLWGAAA